MHTVLLVIILPLIITIICYHYGKQKAWCASNIKWKILNFKKFVLKILCIIISIAIKLEDFEIDNILKDEKSHEIILVYDISYKALIGSKTLHVRFDRIDGFIRIYHGTNIKNSLALKNFMLVTTKWDNLYLKTKK